MRRQPCRFANREWSELPLEISPRWQSTCMRRSWCRHAPCCKPTAKSASDWRPSITRVGIRQFWIAQASMNQNRTNQPRRSYEEVRENKEADESEESRQAEVIGVLCSKQTARISSDHSGR